ncbi:MAG: glycosyltransferase family 4 protein [Nitriliruptoraceae bacterium]|nr:glycosyltransferase family 4 protein [Nitriliruptoraceae bacterium]
MPRRRRPQRERPLLVHLTTVDLSLAYLLLPQLIAFREAGYDVVGVSAPGPHVATLEANGIRHVPLTRSTRAADLRADIATAREFWSICRRLRPDIVHTHNPKPGVYGRILARLAGVPVVVNTVHGLYALPTDPLPKRVVVYTLERIAAAFSHAELLQNVEDRATLRSLRIPAPKLHVLGNGVDLSRFDPTALAGERAAVRAELGLGDDEVAIGLVGRLVAEKGYREVFAAASTLAATHPQARFVVVGPADPDKADAITRAELDTAEAAGVRLLGMREDVERLYPAFDCYVLASYREGFPRSAMEAAAMGLPIVATDIRGCRQVVDDGVTGHLVPARDAAALTDAIARLVGDATARSDMGEAARAKALAEFDDRRQVAITLDTYRRLLPRGWMR